MEETIRKFKQHLAKMNAYQHAFGVLNYDSETVMPRGGSEHLGRTYAVLSEEMYKLTTSPELKAWAKEIMTHADEADPVTRKEAERLLEDMERMEKVPMAEYVAYQVAQNDAANAWHTAKVTNDFALFAPHLEKVIDYTRRFAGYWDNAKAPYDVLLDVYEKGLTREMLDPFFALLRSELGPVVEAVAEKGPVVDDSFLYKRFPLAKQRRLSDRLMEVMTIDRNHCNIGEVEHPFTTNFTKDDVRITTHYYEKDFTSSMFSVLHEGGHALYELHVGDDIKCSPLGEGASMSIHESQSRFFENIIGRSEAFLTYILPDIRKLGPKALKDVPARDFYRAVNKAQPSLIRTQADELTYSFHVMIRYELEKRLFDGTLAVKDLPAAWNVLYKEYLGVDVPDDTHGVLQDSHWSNGLFGYFPSYALGSAYGAQMLKVMERDIPVWDYVARGDLKPIVAWLTERIYQYGSMLRPNEIILKACEAPFDPRYYVEYLRSKYTEVYGL